MGSEGKKRTWTYLVFRVVWYLNIITYNVYNTHIVGPRYTTSAEHNKPPTSIIIIIMCVVYTMYCILWVSVQKRNIMTGLAAATCGTGHSSAADFENYCSRAVSERKEKKNIPIYKLGIVLAFCPRSHKAHFASSLNLSLTSCSSWYDIRSIIIIVITHTRIPTTLYYRVTARYLCGYSTIRVFSLLVWYYRYVMISYAAMALLNLFRLLGAVINTTRLQID